MQKNFHHAFSSVKEITMSIPFKVIDRLLPGRDILHFWMFTSIFYSISTKLHHSILRMKEKGNFGPRKSKSTHEISTPKLRQGGKQSGRSQNQIGKVSLTLTMIICQVTAKDFSYRYKRKSSAA